MVGISNHSREITVTVMNHGRESWSLNDGPEYLTAKVVEFKYYYNK